MILVTGAAGKTGQAIIHALLKRNMPIRALVHKKAHIQPMQKFGVQEVLAGDMFSQTRMNEAFQGVKIVYHICPNVSPQEVVIGQIVIKAAQNAGVEHFVYHSVLHPQIEAMPHHWQKMRVEEQLFTSGLAYTILQPAAYMQNLLAYWTDIVQNRVYQVPYAAQTPLSWVDLGDVAEVAATVISEAGHHNAIYELCGTKILSPIEITQILSRYLGYPIDVTVIPLAEWATNARKQGLGAYQVDALTNMFHYYQQFGFVGNSHILTSLLHRPPTSYTTFIEQILNKS